jgi:replication factor C subunit 3/5
MLEAAKVQAGSNVLGATQMLPATDWELYIEQLAKDITAEQSPQRLMAAREKLYELLVNCIPASTILKRLASELIKSLDDSLKLEVLEWAAFYEHRIAMGSKEIFHLEAFVAKFMAIYKVCSVLCSLVLLILGCFSLTEFLFYLDSVRNI